MILKPVDFTDVDSKDVVSSSDSRYYYTFIGSTNGIDIANGETLTGATSGAKLEVLVDLPDGKTELFAKTLTGTPEDSGESWINYAGQTVFIGSGGYREGQNVYLAMGDEYYNQLLRDNDIEQDNENLIDPREVYQIKKILICHVEIEIFSDLINDSRAPFDGQEVIADKYDKKRTYAMQCLDKWLTQLDKNAFFGDSKGTDSPVVSTFYRY
jgi:hypothetical protein